MDNELMDKCEVKIVLEKLLQEVGYGNPLYMSTDDMGDKYKEALRLAIEWLETSQDKWDKLWSVWKTNHLAVLEDSKVSDDFVIHDMERLFRMLEEYTPTEFKRVK